MSAYLVEDETINRVIEWLYWEVTRSPDLKEKLEEALGIDITVYQWYVQLGNAMFQLNVAGVEARYGEGEARRFRELNYRYTPAHGSEIQVLKSLQCWLYQCRKGDVVRSVRRHRGLTPWRHVNVPCRTVGSCSRSALTGGCHRAPCGQGHERRSCRSAVAFGHP